MVLLLLLSLGFGVIYAKKPSINCRILIHLCYEFLCNLLSIVRLHARRPFWRVILHCVGIGLMETINVYMMCGVRYVRRSWVSLVR